MKSVDWLVGPGARVISLELPFCTSYWEFNLTTPMGERNPMAPSTSGYLEYRTGVMKKNKSKRRALLQLQMRIQKRKQPDLQGSSNYIAATRLLLLSQVVGCAFGTSV